MEGRLTSSSVLRKTHRSHRLTQQHNSDSSPTAATPTIDLILSKHDNQRIELKNVIEICRGNRTTIDTEVFLFLPKSVHLSSWQNSELVQDFHSQIRYSVPFFHDNGKRVIEGAKTRLRKAVASANAEELVTACRYLAAVMSEVLTSHLVSHRKLVNAITTSKDAMECASKLCSLGTSILEVSRLIGSVRKLIEGPGGAPQFALFDEYIGNLYVNYLGKTGEKLVAAKELLPKDETVRLEFEHCQRTLETLRREEGSYRRTQATNTKADSLDETTEEHRLARMSHLKKFFQSSLFFDTITKRTSKSLAEPAAISGAACAAVAAYMVEHMNSPFLVDAASRGAAMLSFGTFLYVFKDRLKDRFRHKIEQGMARFLPDLEERLYAKKRCIGVSRTWLRKKTTSELPPEMRELRSKSAASELERSLPEDVLYYRRSIKVDGRRLPGDELLMSLRESVRINLERHARYLDDPYKDYFTLDDSGQLNQKRSHRVYHFYIGVRSSCVTTGKTQSSREKILIKDTIYRVVMDKNGIDRVVLT